MLECVHRCVTKLTEFANYSELRLPREESASETLKTMKGSERCSANVWPGPEVIESGGAQPLDEMRRSRGRVVVESPANETPSFLFRASAKFARRLSPDEARRLVLLLEPNRGTRRNAEENQVSGRLRNVRTHLAMSRHLLRLFPNALEEDVPQLHELHSVSALVFGHGAGAFARAFLHVAPVAGWLQSLRRVRELGQGASGTVIEVPYSEILGHVGLCA